jgi:hypothetical protein
MIKPPNRTAYKRVLKSIEQCRLEVEKLIDQTPKDDHHAIGLLGPILSDLRNAAREVAKLD